MGKTRAHGASARPATVIGWREWVELPDLGLPPFPGKIDTGARTSALHARKIRLEPQEEGPDMVSFILPTIAHRRGRRVALPVHDERLIRNTGGKPEMRLVVRTLLRLGRRRWHIDVSLTDRTNMTHELILGRTAVRGHRLLVDPGRSFLTGHPEGAPSTDTATPAA